MVGIRTKVFTIVVFQARENRYSDNYSNLSKSRGGWNKRGGGAKVPELINTEVGINVEGGIFWKKKLVYNCNKREVEGGKKSR